MTDTEMPSCISNACFIYHGFLLGTKISTFPKIGAGSNPYVLPHLSRRTKGEQARELGNFLTALGLPKIRFHDLRATWSTIMLGRGIEPAKVMFMGGWKDMKTTMVYLRKAGISIRGMPDGLHLHDHVRPIAKVIEANF